MRRIALLVPILLFFGPAARALDLDLVTVGDPQVCDESFMSPTGLGCVEETYQIATFEISNFDYIEFLNAMAADNGDPNDLFSEAARAGQNFSGIFRESGSGTSEDPWVYKNVPGLGIRSVNFVDWLDAARFVNWLENGQPTAAENPLATENGTYDLSQLEPARNPNARWVLPNQDEWYKAAFFDPSPSGPPDDFWVFSPQSDTIICENPPGGPISGNCDDPGTILESRGPLRGGAYPEAMSFYGTFDQSGNVAEWIELFFAQGCPFGSGICAVEMGGSFASTDDNSPPDPNTLVDLSALALGNAVNAARANKQRGFRVAFVSEPGELAQRAAGVLVLAVLAAHARRRR